MASHKGLFTGSVVFVIYLNTMLARIADLDVHLYVDDTNEFHEISYVNDVEAL